MCNEGRVHITHRFACIVRCVIRTRPQLHIARAIHLPRRFEPVPMDITISIITTLVLTVVNGYFSMSELSLIHI